MKAKFILLVVILIMPLSSMAKGYWSTKNVTAYTEFKNGLIIGISFAPESDCHDAVLMIQGNTDVNAIGAIVDGQAFNATAVEKVYEADIVGVVISNAFLRAIKKGNFMKLFTDQGDLRVGLYGSAKALNQAYNNCEKLHSEVGI